MTEVPVGSMGPDAGSSRKAWPIAFAVVLVLLLLAVAYIVVRRDAADETSTTGTTGAATSASTARSASDIVCRSEDLLAATDAETIADSSVAEYGCAPAPSGSAVDAYAWVRLETPGANAPAVFYEGRARQPGRTPAIMDWRVVRAGTDVVCEDVMDVAVCDMLPGTWRRTQPPPAENSSTTTQRSTTDRSVRYEMQCTPADLLAAVEPGVLADGARVVEHACTPTALDAADTAYAYARIEAPNVDPVIVLYSAVALVEPGAPTVVDWQDVAHGSSVVCDEHLPRDACAQLSGVPRR